MRSHNRFIEVEEHIFVHECEGSKDESYISICLINFTTGYQLIKSEEGVKIKNFADEHSGVIKITTETIAEGLIIDIWQSTSRYLDDLLNIDNPYFEGMVNQIYPSELQLNKANTSDTEAPFLDLHLSISNGFVSSKIYDKRDDFDFDIVNFPFLDGDVPHRPSYGVYISQLIRFARVCSHVDDFNTHNKCLTAKLL